MEAAEFLRTIGHMHSAHANYLGRAPLDGNGHAARAEWEKAAEVCNPETPKTKNATRKTKPGTKNSKPET